MIHQVFAGSAAAATAAVTSCGNYQNFYVICHGMMLFQFVPGPQLFESLILHLPAVPATRSDRHGHVYKAGSSRYGPRFLDTSGGATYHLRGAAGNTRPPSEINPATNIFLKSSASCSLEGGTPPLIKIYMPVPDSYESWRFSLVNSGSIVSNTDTNRPFCPNEPAKIYGTHIFVYKDIRRIVLSEDGASGPLWGQKNNSDNRLHIFSEPQIPVDDPKFDHTHHLYDLFNYETLYGHCPLKDAAADQICIGEGPLPNGFTRTELLDLGEDRDEQSDKPCSFSVPRLPLKGGPHMTNCKSMFMFGS
jgi:hypothetical protein